MSLEFFSSTLPDQGYYCIGLLKDNGAFAHRWFEDKEKAYSYALAMSEKGETVYYGQAGYTEPTNRKGENASHFRAFFLDIDCGPTKAEPDARGRIKGYIDQQSGMAALRQLCKDLNLPKPTIVNSGLAITDPRFRRRGIGGGLGWIP